MDKPTPYQLVKSRKPDFDNYRRSRINSFRKRTITQRIFGLAVIIILILTPLGILSMDFPSSEFKIAIDGEFDDWVGLKGYPDSQTDQLSNPSTNLIELKIVDSSTDIYLYAEVYEKMFDRLSGNLELDDPLRISSLYFLIDDDLNKNTGYYIHGIGADILLRIRGQSGVIASSTIHLFSSDASPDDWNGWKSIGNIISSNGGSALEVQLPKTFLAHDQFVISAMIKDGMGNEDIVDHHIGFGIAVANMKFGSMYDGTIGTGDAEIEEYLLFSGEVNIAGGNSHLEEINLKINSWKNPDDLGIFSFSLRLSGPDTDGTVQSDKIVLHSQYQSSVPGFMYEFGLGYEFEVPIPMQDGIKLEMMVYFKVDDQADACRFDLIVTDTALVLSNGKLLLSDTYDDFKLTLSIGESGEDIIIDGIFFDWFNKDEEIDFDLSSGLNPDIDIDSYKIFEDESSISFYFSVKGMILRGTSIPETPKPVGSISKAIGGEIDQDPGPDVVDTGIKKSPAFALPAELLGEDKAFIFIDSDDDIETGYSTGWMDIGADFGIEINGKNGQIMKKDLLRYSTEGGDKWKWDNVGEIDSAVDNKRLETQVDLALLGLKPGSLYHYFIYISDWNSDSDSAGGSTPVSRAFPGSLPESLANLLGEDSKNNSRISEKGEADESDDVQDRSTRSLKIGNSSSYLSTSETNQYKLVRDSKGIWFAFWQTGYEIYGANSTTSSGDTWNQEWLLIGSGGGVVDTTNDAEYVTVAIERDEGSGNDKIHLVCTYNIDDVLYTKLVDTGDFKNSSGSAWKVANESRTGFELIDGVVGYSINLPSIAVNTTGISHVVWTQNSTNSRLYYTHSSPGKWTKPFMITNDTGGPGNSVPTIDADASDNLHLGWFNFTSEDIDYKRCLNTSNSSRVSSWRSADQTGDKDSIIYSGNKMFFPSLATDINNNVWVVTHERVVFDIWFTKCIDKNWSAPVKLASQDVLKYPTIGTDSNGYAHAVWLNETTKEIIYAYYTNKWSGNYTLIAPDGQVKYYPSIERHMWSAANLSGVIYINSTNKDVSFEDAGNKVDIPEFGTAFQITAVCAAVVILNFIFIRKRRELEHGRE